MVEQIVLARRKKDSLGGKFEVRVSGLPIGRGSYVHYERKLDGRLAQILTSMLSIKAVEIGDGSEPGGLFGSERISSTLPAGPRAQSCGIGDSS